MKKRILFIIAFIIGMLPTHAQQQVTVPAGTKIPVVSPAKIKGGKVDTEHIVDFLVADDVVVDGVVVVKKGQYVKGVVTKAKSSLFCGIPGTLQIDFNRVYTVSGDPISLSGSRIYKKGQNRVLLACLMVWTYGPFWCIGEGGKVHEGDTFDLYTSEHKTITVE